MTSSQAIVHAVLPDNNPEVSLWHHPILSDDVPVGYIVQRQVELDLLSLPRFE